MDIAIHTKDITLAPGHPAVVLLPAYPFDHRMWEGVARRIEGVPIISIDPPGFGDSPAVLDSPSLEVYSDLVAQAVISRGASTALVCGCSMGGYTALAMLQRHPKLVRGIVLLGTSARADSAEKRAQRVELSVQAMVGRLDPAADLPSMVSEQTAQQHPEMLEMLTDWVHQPSGEALAWAQRAMAARPDRLDVLTDADVAATVMRGSQDRIIDTQAAQEMADALGVEVESVDEGGHLLPIETPGRVARAILRVYTQL